MSDKQAETDGIAERDRNSTGHRQRRKILVALDQCMRKQGYAATTLADIALKAEMSPSHMRYYFASKEDILEFYFERLCDRIIAETMHIPRITPEQWLEDFVKFSMGTENMDRASLAILIEIFAVAVHHEGLGKLKARFDSHMARIYLEFFQWAGTAPGIDAYEAAYRARWLEIGAKMTALFQRDFSLEKAREIFTEQIRVLSGLEIAATPRQLRARARKQ